VPKKFNDRMYDKHNSTTFVLTDVTSDHEVHVLHTLTSIQELFYS